MVGVILEVVLGMKGIEREKLLGFPLHRGYEEGFVPGLALFSSLLAG